MIQIERDKDKPTTPRLPSGATWGRRLGGLALCVLLATNLAFSGQEKQANEVDKPAHTKISKDLEGLDGDTTIKAIVRFKHTPTEDQLQKVCDLGGTLKNYRDGEKNAAFTLPAAALKDLATDPDVVSISADLSSQDQPDYLLGLVGNNQPRDPGSKISSDLQGADPNSNLKVIVQFTEPPTSSHHETVIAQGGEHLKNLRLVNGALYTVPASALAELAKDPRVAFISPDRPVRRSLDHVVQAVNADIAQSYGWDGTGIGVAVVDSGIQAHPDLKASGLSTSRVVYSESFVPGDPSTTDGYGHGTHVAGIIAGNGQGSASYRGAYRGIAPNVQIINLRVLDNNGAGTDSAVIAAIQRAIQLKAVYNIRVLNLSLGRGVHGSYTLDPLCQAVEAAWQAGIVVVVSAGNAGRDNSLSTSGYGTITAPGNDPYAITVGAMKTLRTPSRGDDLMASYSSKGPTLLDHIVQPDLVAPGNRIVSASSTGMNLAGNYPANRVSYSYYMTNGTGRSFDYFMLSGTS